MNYRIHFEHCLQLSDICKFLSSEKLTSLPQKDKKLAESLIRRSKRQLQEISKIQCTVQNEEYVIMDRKGLLSMWFESV
nr:unnamed protein product [Callosobruchus analis]